MVTFLNEGEIIAARVYGLRPAEARLLTDLRESYPKILPHCRNHNKGSRKVWVCNLRKKLRPYGFDVNNVRGKGYRLVEVSA
jgi:DNA-binding response OmpR family regulator